MIDTYLDPSEIATIMEADESDDILNYEEPESESEPESITQELFWKIEEAFTKHHIKLKGYSLDGGGIEIQWPEGGYRIYLKPGKDFTPTGQLTNRGSKQLIALAKAGQQKLHPKEPEEPGKSKADRVEGSIGAGKLNDVIIAWLEKASSGSVKRDDIKIGYHGLIVTNTKTKKRIILSQDDFQAAHKDPTAFKSKLMQLIPPRSHYKNVSDEPIAMDKPTRKREQQLSLV